MQQSFCVLCTAVSAINIYELYIPWSGTLRGVRNRGAKGPGLPKFLDDTLFCEKTRFRQINISMGNKHLILKENLNSALLLADISHVNWGL